MSDFIVDYVKILYDPLYDALGGNIEMFYPVAIIIIIIGGYTLCVVTSKEWRQTVKRSATTYKLAYVMFVVVTFYLVTFSILMFVISPGVLIQT